MDRGTEASPEPVEPRQRWRITFARGPVPTDRVGRSALDAWGASLASSGLPIAGLTPDGGRARFALGAPLPASARGERELIEVWLLERLPAWRVRTALAPALPEAHAWVDAQDVWLGAPALAGRIVAADWRIELDDPTLDADRLAIAAAALDAARSIPRVRLKGATEKRYDLRRLLAGIDLEARVDPNDAPVVVARTRFDPELGSGRPEEVVAALGETARLSLGIAAMTRTRLLLEDDLS